MIIRRRIGLLVAAPLLAFSLEASGAGNGRTEPFEIEGTTAQVRWEVMPQEEGPMCHFGAWLIGLDDAGATRSVDLIATVDAVPRRAARAMGLEERPSGDVEIAVAPGTYVVSLFSEHMREADGTRHGCESWRVTVDG